MDHLRAADLLDTVEARGYQRKYGAWFFRGDERSGRFWEQFSLALNIRGRYRHDFDQLLAETVTSHGVAISLLTCSAALRPALHVLRNGDCALAGYSMPVAMAGF